MICSSAASEDKFVAKLNKLVVASPQTLCAKIYIKLDLNVDASDHYGVDRQVQYISTKDNNEIAASSHFTYKTSAQYYSLDDFFASCSGYHESINISTDNRIAAGKLAKKYSKCVAIALPELSMEILNGTSPAIYLPVRFMTFAEFKETIAGPAYLRFFGISVPNYPAFDTFIPGLVNILMPTRWSEFSKIAEDPVMGAALDRLLCKPMA